MTGSPWGAWVFMIIVSYLTGVVFTAAVPYLARLVFFRGEEKHAEDEDDDPEPSAPRKD